MSKQKKQPDDPAVMFYRVEQFHKSFRTTVITIGIALTALFGIAFPVYWSSGKTTSISYVVNWMQAVSLDAKISYAVAIGASLWAIGERRKKLSERADKDARNAKLESAIDPKRKGSGLNPDGTMKEHGDE